MLELFRAEWLKISGNRWVAGFLIWVFPLGAVGFVAIMGLIFAFSPAARAEIRAGSILWTEQALSAWSIPNNEIGRLFLLGFTSVIFAGEYQWQTWKNIVPRTHRAALILIKFLTLGAFVIIAFALMSIIWVIGWAILTQLAGAAYGPALTDGVLIAFLRDYATQGSLACMGALINAGYAALAGLLTRSVLGGLLVAFVISIAEIISPLGLRLAGQLLHTPRIVNIYRFLPTYNLQNLESWLSSNAATVLYPYNESGPYSHIILSDTLAFSSAVVFVWIAGLMALTAALFQRQDITS